MGGFLFFFIAYFIAYFIVSLFIQQTILVMMIVSIIMSFVYSLLFVPRTTSFYKDINFWKSFFITAISFLLIDWLMEVLF